MPKKRSTLREFLRCQVGTHNVPKNAAIQIYGIIFQGGKCPVCGDVVWDHTKKLGDHEDAADLKKAGWTLYKGG